MKTTEPKTGTQLIAEERERQITQEGWTPEHDDQHSEDQLARAAACYCMDRIAIIVKGPLPKESALNVAYPGPDSLTWPWEKEWWKPSGDPVRNLIKAGALIAAEIDRLQRARP